MPRKFLGGTDTASLRAVMLSAKRVSDGTEMRSAAGELVNRARFLGIGAGRSAITPPLRFERRIG